MPEMGQKPSKSFSFNYVRSTPMNGPWNGIGLLPEPKLTKFDSGVDDRN